MHLYITEQNSVFHCFKISSISRFGWTLSSLPSLTDLFSTFYLTKCFSLFWTHKLASPRDSTPVFLSFLFHRCGPSLTFTTAAHHLALFSCLSSLSVFKGPLLFFKSPLTQPHVDPPLSAPPSPPPAGPLSLVRGLAVRPSPVSAAAAISSGPSGGLLLTSQA